MDKVVDLILNGLSQFWGVWGGMIVAMMVRRAVRASFNIILAIIFASIVVTILTMVGILPPLDVMISSFLSLFS